VEAHDLPADRHGARRAALRLGAVAGLVAVAGLSIALLQHPKAAETPPTSNPPGLTAGFTGPLTGLGFSVADDVASHQVVLFGGLDSAATTWLWDGARWRVADPRSSPPGRSGAAAAYDPATRTVMLFGGSVGPGMSANDTWAWNGTNWRPLNSDGARPPAGTGAQMAWDSTTSQMVLVTDAEVGTGAETWTWDGVRWERQTQGDLSVNVFGDVLAYDPDSHSLLLVSPISADSEKSLTLTWNGARWRLLATDAPPIEGMALDPLARVLIGCGNATYSEETNVQSSCWEWTGSAWTEIQQAVPPPDSRQVVIEVEVSDVDHDRILMFGWLISAIPGQPQPLHIWWLDDGSWTQLA
jgi:hypothetical protein